MAEQTFIDKFFKLLGSSYEFLEILENITNKIGWSNYFMGFEFPDDYDEYSAKKIYINRYENFDIDDSIRIYIDIYGIEEDEKIISQKLFIDKLINVSFKICIECGDIIYDNDLKKVYNLINKLKKTAD